MDDPGQRLKRTRERLGLKYRDVEEFSQQIADRHRNQEYAVVISRLSDIENRGVLPNIFKLYTLAAIYRLDLAEILRWYGVEAAELASDAAGLLPERTQLIGLGREHLSRLQAGEIQVPLSLDPGLDLNKTSFLSRFIQSWGTLPVLLLAGQDLPSYRYATVGLEDWFMHPLLAPGALLLVDDAKRKVVGGGWKDERERPIYLLEHREGWVCAWCSVVGETLVAQPHPASACQPLLFKFPEEVEVIGQVIGAANRFDGGQRRG